MPTKENLSEIDIEYVRELLCRLLTSVNQFTLAFVIQQIYELSAILISYKAECTSVRDKACADIIPKWRLLQSTRNAISHNLYNITRVRQTLSDVYDSTVLLDVCREALGDETLAYPIYYLIGDVLRTRELFL